MVTLNIIRISILILNALVLFLVVLFLSNQWILSLALLLMLLIIIISYSDVKKRIYENEREHNIMAKIKMVQRLENIQNSVKEVKEGIERNMFSLQNQIESLKEGNEDNERLCNERFEYLKERLKPLEQDSLNN